MAAPNKDRENWFQRNPAKTIVLFCLLVSLVLMFGAELALKANDTEKAARRRNKGGTQRSIRLREYVPRSVKYYTPPNDYMSTVDSLTQGEFRIAADENGFILPSTRHDHPDLSIFFLGDSTTECMFVDEPNRFPYLVGYYLEKRTGKKVNSFNGGVSGNNSLHSLDILINKVLPLGPNVVVMSHNMNDLNILIYEGTYWNGNPTRSVICEIKEQRMLLGSYVLKVIRGIIPELCRRLERLTTAQAQQGAFDEFAHLRGQKLAIDKDRLVTEFAVNLRAFVAVCKVRKIMPVLMTQANRLKPEPDEIIRRSLANLYDFGISYEAYTDAYQAFNECIREVAAQEEILLIDLAKEIPQDKQYIYDSIHFNDEGSKLAASIITERLLTHLLRQQNGAGDAGPRLSQ